MSRYRAGITILLLAYGSAAAAHPHLRMSIPAEGSVITAAPSQVTLGYSEVSRLLALSLQKGAEPAVKITSLPQQPAQQLTVALPALAPGVYQLRWRALGDDGHVTSGSVHFTLVAPRP